MDSEKTAAENAESAASPLSGMLATLLSHPEMLEQIQSALNVSVPGSAGSPAPAEESPAVQTSAAPPSPGMDGLASVLANPEMMAKLPQMMAVLKPMLASDAIRRPPDHHPNSPEEYRNNLLLALKPFLSAERQNAVDAILHISKLGTVIRQIK